MEEEAWLPLIREGGQARFQETIILRHYTGRAANLFPPFKRQIIISDLNVNPSWEPMKSSFSPGNFLSVITFLALLREEGFRTYQEKMKKESFATVRLGFVFLLTGKFERKFSFKLLRLKCSKLFQKKKEKKKGKKEARIVRFKSENC